MVIINPHTIRDTEPCTVAGEMWFWGNMGENGKDEFVWEFETCEMEMVNTRSKRLMRRLVLRLV